jgi:anti-sigma regulatory factor (Ser/Thr protein kinase)
VGSGALNRQLDRTFKADPSALRDVRAFIRERAGESGVPAETLHDLLIAVSEACTNIVRYADAPEMKLRWRVEEDRVEVEVEDTGVFVHRPPDPDRVGGFGIPLMRSLMDDVVLRRGDGERPGTSVLLVKRLAARTAMPSLTDERRRRAPLFRRVGLAAAAGLPWPPPRWVR